MDRNKLGDPCLDPKSPIDMSQYRMGVGTKGMRGFKVIQKNTLRIKNAKTNIVIMSLQNRDYFIRL